MILVNHWLRCCVTRWFVELNDDRVQCCLLVESKLTFEKVYLLVQALETADHDAKELQELPAATINKLNRDTTKRSPTNTAPAYHKALRIAVTTVEENTLHQIVDFIKWSAVFPRR